MQNSVIAMCFIAVSMLAGCWDTTIIAIEQSESVPTDGTEVDTVVDTTADTQTSSNTDTDSGTGTEAETDTGTGKDTETDTGTGIGCGVPSSFSWTSSGPLILPPSDHFSIKDPTVVYDADAWRVYATTRPDANSFSMVYLGVTDWNQADAAVKTPVSTNGNLTGYKAAPQLFYFSPHGLWYLVCQTPEPAYSTTADPSDVASWSAMQTLLVTENYFADDENVTTGIDYWVICDETDCYLFFSALNGVLYRARTAKDLFPEGFGTIEIAMQDSQYALFDASSVYKLGGTDQYLLLVEAIGDSGRYVRAWTSDRLDGGWVRLADTEDNAFASVNNITGLDWTSDGITHGEMLRSNPDETMTIDTCDMRYLFCGLRPRAMDTDPEVYNLGLLTDAVAR